MPDKFEDWFESIHPRPGENNAPAFVAWERSYDLASSAWSAALATRGAAPTPATLDGEARVIIATALNALKSADGFILKKHGLSNPARTQTIKDCAKYLAAPPIPESPWKAPLFDPARMPERDADGEQIHPDMAAFFSEESTNSETVKKILAGLGWEMEAEEWDDEFCDAADWNPGPPELNAGWFRAGFIESEDGLFALFVRPAAPDSPKGGEA